MASAQVLPNSGASLRKGHLEAGKRRLEEFRKKKAEGRARRPALTGQLQSTDLGQYDKQSQESEHTRLTNSDGASMSERDGVSAIEPSGLVTACDSKAISSFESTGLGLSNGLHSNPSSANNYNSFSADPVQEPAEDQESKCYDGSGLPGSIYTNNDWHKEEKNSDLGAGSEYGFTMGSSTALFPVLGIRDIDRNVHQSSYYSIGEAQSNENETSSNEYMIEDPGMPPSEKSVNVPVQSKIGFASTLGSGNTSTSYGDSIRSSTNFKESASEVEPSMHGSVDSYSSSSTNHHPSADSAPWPKSESLSTGYSLDVKISPNHAPLSSALTETGSRRYRPSFLDSLNVPRVSSLFQLPVTESEKAESFMSKSSKVHSVDILESFASQKQYMEADSYLSKSKSQNLLSGYEPSINYLVPPSNDGELQRQNVKENSSERKHEILSLKQDDDFAALEQHIEDLTQEKFSLQRALEASRTLAESLAIENSSLTNSFNQQGTVVNQLKFDMVRLQEDIRIHLLELESIKIEYANAQLECNAADERAKILASEVIGLEEKALRLRSNELKLERQLEDSNAEITSYKKKVSSLEKECQDLQSTIDALQEEKKLLQSKLRKASTSVRSIDVSKKSSSTKNVSTSTEDIGVDVFDSVVGENSGEDIMSSAFNNEMQDTASLPLSRTSTYPLLPENRQFHPSVAAGAIPTDQLRMIDDINSLISELALEKEELMRAFAVESSHSSKLKDLNKELSQKLEVQTQRLELLTAQSMANENVQARQSDPHPMHDSSVYTDEGDEVVERVLGWIMKLFPGGPSKHRTSKLL